MSILILKRHHGCLPENVSKIYTAAVTSAVAIAVLLFTPQNLTAADGIRAERKNGRVIFVNADTPPQAPDGISNTPTVNKRLVYWSNVEHRWKRVPMTSKAARIARTAAQEVSAALNDSSPATTAALAVHSTAPELASVAPVQRITQHNVDAAIEAAAKRHNIDVNLVRAMIQVESNFNPQAVSKKGAMGLMQLMPSTARELNVRNPFDPTQNVEGGVRHFKLLLDNFGGDVQLSLAAYNAGSGAVTRNRGLPPYAETRDYVKKITRLYGGNAAQTQGTATSIRTSRNADGHLMFSNDE